MGEYVTALQFLREAHSILNHYCPQMLSRTEWNMAARAGYEAMEKAAKAIELLAGVHLSTQHDVTIQQQVLDRLPLVAWRVEEDPSASTSLCAAKRYIPSPHVALLRVSQGSFTQLAAAGCDPSAPLEMILDGSTILVYAGPNAILSVTDTVAGVSLNGHWIQVLIGPTQLQLLNDFLRSVPKGRNVSAYYGRVFDARSAEEVRNNGMSLFVPVKRRVGHRLGDSAPRGGRPNNGL
jgi:hypothetical protein